MRKRPVQMALAEKMASRVYCDVGYPVLDNGDEPSILPGPWNGTPQGQFLWLLRDTVRPVFKHVPFVWTTQLAAQDGAMVWYNVHVAAQLRACRGGWRLLLQFR